MKVKCRLIERYLEHEKILLYRMTYQTLKFCRSVYVFILIFVFRNLIWLWKDLLFAESFYLILHLKYYIIFLD